MLLADRWLWVAMLLVERHYVKGNAELVRLAECSKLLFNQCNYYVRQAYFDWRDKCEIASAVDGKAPKLKLPNMTELVRLVEGEDFYQNLHNTKTAKQTILKVLNDWSNYFKSMREWRKNPEKFERKPKPPGYKQNLAQVIFYDETIRKKLVRRGTIQPTNDCFSITSNRKFKQVLVTPKTFGFIIDVQYEAEMSPESKPTKGGVLCIDLGVNNLCAITSDQLSPVLINGRILKSINRYFNQKPLSKRRSRKRYFRIENYFHHVSKYLIQLCRKHGITQIIIGRNEGWKQRMNMGKRNNQNFQYIPFYRLIEKIEYKAKLAGITVETTEESYTSKASYLDRDPLDGSKLSGKRVKRGLYRTVAGVLINADLNGSGNIGRKVIRDIEILDGLDRSVAATPVRVNPLRVFRCEPKHKKSKAAA